MQKKKTYKSVGIFVIIGFLCFVGIIFNYLGKQLVTPEEDLVVMYFEEPINGLSIGSPVLLQGLEIGKVEKIEMIANLTEGKFQIPVYVLITGEKVSVVEFDENMSDQELLQNLIERGLRARLSSASLLTGQLNIELIMDPKQPAVMRGDGAMAEIPTILSPYAKISKDLDEIPLQESLSRIGDLVISLDKDLPPILDNMTGITKTLNEQLPKLLHSSADISKNINNIFDGENGELSRTMRSVNSTMEEISKASRSIKNLTDYLERHPESIIKGKEK